MNWTIGLFVIGWAANVGLVITGIYVVCHFVTKFW